MVRRGWWAVVVPLVLSACGGMPLDSDRSVQTPVSQQAAVGDAQRAAKAHTDLGMVYLREGQLNVALDEARKAIEADSSYPLGYNLYGLVQMYLEDNRAAEESLGRALQLAPADPEINNNYGWFLCQSGRQKQSIEYFVAASKNTLYVAPTKPLTNAAICSIGAGDDKGAEEFLTKALRADPQNGDAHFLLAELYYRTGRLIDARLRLADVHRLTAPTAQSVWLGLRVERKLGDREAEARYGKQLRREFQDSREFQLLKQGIYQ
ncbi:MAG: type IV pilus biogenesis/stability protein PilW [Rhodocyclales bacterium]|nr:type IV pilus biogenesis/stability protein PilW [Rhodocyclales bacterium]